MKILSESGIPKITVDADVYGKIQKYAKLLKGKATLVAGFIYENDSKEIRLIEVFMPKQKTEYTSNKSTYEDIHSSVCIVEDENYGTVFYKCLIKTDSSNTPSVFKTEDYTYFEKLCDESDCLIVGEVTKDGFLQLHYMDLEKRIAVSYVKTEVELSSKYDRHFSINYCLDSDSEIEEDIKANTIPKTYSSSYGSTYNSTNSSSYKPAVVSKSELNEKDYDLFSVVS